MAFAEQQLPPYVSTAFRISLLQVATRRITMPRNILLLTITILSISLPAVAQIPPTVADLVIDPEAVSPTIKLYWNNTNNRILLAYEIMDPVTSQISLKVRYINPFGGMGRAFKVASNIDSSGMWDLAWHAVVSKYLVVYRKDNALLAQVLRATSKPKGPPKKISDYDGDRFFLTWTTENRYVLFFERESRLAAQVLRRTGRKFGSEKNLAGGELTGEAYPVDATTEADGTAVAYFALYSALETNRLTPSVLKTNHTLKVIDQFAITDPYVVLDKESFMGDYDPGSGMHMIMWAFQPVDPAVTEPTPYYAIFRENGQNVLPPTVVPDDRMPLNLTYNPLSERFASLFTWETEEGGVTTTNFGLMIFKPNGVLVSPGTNIGQEDETNILQVGGSYSQLGNFLLVWTLGESGNKGVYAKLFY